MTCRNYASLIKFFLETQFATIANDMSFTTLDMKINMSYKVIPLVENAFVHVNELH